MENILSAIRANIQTVLVGEERAASLLLTAPVSYTHLDVYKRQGHPLSIPGAGG